MTSIRASRSAATSARTSAGSPSRASVVTATPARLGARRALGQHLGGALGHRGVEVVRLAADDDLLVGEDQRRSAAPSSPASPQALRQRRARRRPCRRTR